MNSTVAHSLILYMSFFCSDKLFPAFGFGAKIGDKVSHEFPLNNNWENPYCAGIAGVIQAYHQSLQNVQLYGPTNVAPIINHAASFAQKAAANEQPGASATQVGGVIHVQPLTITML